jgi:hypothetical protein
MAQPSCLGFGLAQLTPWMHVITVHCKPSPSETLDPLLAIPRQLKDIVDYDTSSYITNDGTGVETQFFHIYIFYSHIN